MNGRPAPDRVEHVAIIGAGLIGAGWVAYFLARGLSVRAFDPAPNAEPRIRAHVAAAWPAMVQAGVATGPALYPVVCPSIAEACAGVEFVQENGPEDIALKRGLIAEIDAACAPNIVIASSSSSLLPSDYQGAAAQPGRVLAAHPFNPPSLVPLVEVAGGQATDLQAVAWTIAFFEAVGKVPVHVRRERPGYIANRMTAALYREAVDLVASGTASVADVDRAIASGPGLRWAVMGPHLLYHLAGGGGGYRHYLDHLGPSQEARWRDLGTTALDGSVRDALVAGVEAEIAALAPADPAAYRDDAMAAIMVAMAEVRARHG